MVTDDVRNVQHDLIKVVYFDGQSASGYLDLSAGGKEVMTAEDVQERTSNLHAEIEAKVAAKLSWLPFPGGSAEAGGGVDLPGWAEHPKQDVVQHDSHVQGVHRRRLRGCTRRDQVATPSVDLVERRFTPQAPNRLYVADVTQHRTAQRWLYFAVVIDCFSRRVVGWSIADHIRSGLVVDALQMAIWNRRPAAGAIHHSDHGSTYTSWAFGHRLREAGLLGSMGSIGDCFDNCVAESFFATLQTELLDRSTWPTREGLANAIFAFIEGFYNPRRRHSTRGYLSPADYETQHALTTPAGRHAETAA